MTGVGVEVAEAVELAVLLANGILVVVAFPPLKVTMELEVLRVTTMADEFEESVAVELGPAVIVAMPDESSERVRVEE